MLQFSSAVTVFLLAAIQGLEVTVHHIPLSNPTRSPMPRDFISTSVKHIAHGLPPTYLPIFYELHKVCLPSCCFVQPFMYILTVQIVTCHCCHKCDISDSVPRTEAISKLDREYNRYCSTNKN